MNRSQAGAFPWLGPEDHFEFPDSSEADSAGIVAVGGNLSPGMLLSAYRQGVFPWFNEDDPIIWWSPDPRFVLFTDEVHISRSMHRVLKSDRFRVTADTVFPEVITNCARTPRSGQRGTWITEDMQLAYRHLFELGFAHSLETWEGSSLVGGLYGVAIGRMFYGESMFSHSPNASKFALINLARFIQAHGFDVIDAQEDTPHMSSMGGRAISRAQFISAVDERVSQPGLPGSWKGRFESFLST